MAKPPVRPVRTRHIDSPVGVGARLREARARAGLTLRQLAFAGCTPPYISAIEHGRRTPSLQILQELALRLDVAVGWLATGETARPVDQLADAELALRLGDAELAARLFEQLADESERADVRARAVAGLGELQFHAGDVAGAIERFEHALRLAPDDIAELATAVELLGRCYASRGELETAISVLDRARTTALHQGDRLRALRFSVLLANAYVDVGDLGGSASTIAGALQDAGDLADPVLRARVEWTQSRLHTVEGRHDLALEFAQRALATLRVGEDDHAVARAQQLLAYIEIERGNPDDALALLDAAEPAMTRSGGATEQATFELERARALLALGRAEESKELAIRVAPVLLESAKGNGGRLFIVLGEIFEATGDSDAALEMFDAAVDSLEGHRSPYLTQAFQAKAGVLEGLGRSDEALAALKQALRMQAPARRAG